MFRREGDTEVAEDFAQEARYFTESRLLQRDVKIILEGVSNQNFLGSVIHPVSCPRFSQSLVKPLLCWGLSVTIAIVSSKLTLSVTLFIPETSYYSLD